jgi:hypothetical protein
MMSGAVLICVRDKARLHSIMRFHLERCHGWDGLAQRSY